MTILAPYMFNHNRSSNENGRWTRYNHTRPLHNADSDVFQSVEVPIRPLRNQNANINE